VARWRKAKIRSPNKARAALVLAIVFVGVHLLLWWGNTVPINNTLATDTGTYVRWMEQWRATGRLVGIDVPWVYPIGALPFMQLPFLLGGKGYLALWIAMVGVLDAVAMVLLALRSLRAAWWWLGCLALLGPAGLSHLDGVAAPFAIAGVLAIRRRPAIASALFTLAAWIKVWPAAMVAALLVAQRRRIPPLLAAVVTSAAIVTIAVAAGGRQTLFSFVTAQAARGLQIEAPVSTFWMIWGALNGPAHIFYDHQILTFEVNGPGTHSASTAVTVVLAVGVTGVVVFALRALRQGRDRQEVLALTALGLVSAVIALNKVGSPQYYTWLPAPVLLGLLTTRAFRSPAVLVLVVSAFTFLIYPIGYDGVLALDPVMVGVLAIRNALVVLLFLWALLRLVGRRGRGDADGRRVLAALTS
jgi:glycosyl transferase family 87